jgi:O-antigen biosynthesis protein
MPRTLAETSYDEDKATSLSVVVVDFNGQRFWPQLLDSLNRQTYRKFEIIVVDNGGSLSLPEIVSDIKIRVERTGRNLGFAAACNLGVSHARGEFVVFLNNDTTVKEDWLEHLVERAESDRRIGAVCSKVLFFPRYVELEIEGPTFRPSDSGASNDGRALGIRLRWDRHWHTSTGPLGFSGFHGRERSGGDLWSWTSGLAKLWIPVDHAQIEIVVETPRLEKGNVTIMKLGKNLHEVAMDGSRKSWAFEISESDCFDVINSSGLERVEGGEWKENGLYKVDTNGFGSPKEVGAFSGCAALVQRSIFEKLGGFDSSFFAYYEDCDLSCRMKREGWKIFYEPKSVVRHHRSSTTLEGSPFFDFHIYRNREWCIAKNEPIGFVLGRLFRELFSCLPDSLKSSQEFSKGRLKRETFGGMLRYLSARIWKAVK